MKSYRIQIAKNIGSTETKRIEINEDSLLTIEDASKIFDAIFECGERFEVAAQNPITGDEVEAYYFCPTKEETRMYREVILSNTAYTPDYNGEEAFKMDFLKWRKLSQVISVELPKRLVNICVCMRRKSDLTRRLNQRNYFVGFTDWRFINETIAKQLRERLKEIEEFLND